ncbi:MAG: D-amino acid aminotransferase [Gammaproteobacteria bacterium]|nr:D-amino acid aminotransferase [Gammaproteobacteria bacterium]
MTTVYLNGNFIPLEQAQVPVLDRGFIFADGVYEVIPVFSGKPFRLKEHVKRLRDSLDGISLQLDYDGEKWQSLIDRLLTLNRVTGDSSIYIQVTRGVAERNHFYQAGSTPTVFIYCKPLQETDVSRGVGAALHEDIRWEYCHIKAVALLPNVMLKQYAREKDGSIEAILYRDGYITEGAASNVFIVTGDTVTTPPKSNRLLPGITRDLVVELIGASPYQCREVPVSKAELLQADEIWITSSTLGIAPVVRLDGRPVSGGKPGPVWRDIDTMYQAFKRNQ